MEFALVVPVLMMFLAALIDVGRFLHVQLMLEQLASDAARYATIPDEQTGALPTAADVTARVDERYPALFKPYTLNVDVSGNLSGDAAVSCQLSTSVKPFLLQVLSSQQQSYTMYASATQPRR